MLVLFYFALFLALSAALLRWQAARYEREDALFARLSSEWERGQRSPEGVPARIRSRR
jgi:hypothetical protein